jgi:UPF0176 protein
MRYTEREKQVKLAKLRGESHIGLPMQQTIEQRRKEKVQFKEAQRREKT